MPVGQVRNTQSKAVSTFGVDKFPTLILLPGGDAPGIVYDGEINKAAMVDFLSQAAQPNPDPAPANGKANGKVPQQKVDQSEKIPMVEGVIVPKPKGKGPKKESNPEIESMVEEARLLLEHEATLEEEAEIETIVMSRMSKAQEEKARSTSSKKKVVLAMLYHCLKRGSLR